LEEIQKEIREVPVNDKKAWEKEVLRLKCEIFSVINPQPPDKSDMNDLRAGMPGMWRDARGRNKKRP